MLEDNQENREAVMRLVGLFESLPGYPRTPGGIEGVVRTVLRFAYSLEKVEKLVNKLLMNADKFPVPAEMAREYRSTWPEDYAKDCECKHLLGFDGRGQCYQCGAARGGDV